MNEQSQARARREIVKNELDALEVCVRAHMSVKMQEEKLQSFSKS